MESRRTATAARLPGGGDVRVGLIGFGMAGAGFHAPLIATTPGLRLSAIVTANRTRADAARREYPAAAVHGDTAALFEGGAVDAVVVATPNRTHVPLAEAALAAGLAVVVDKPLSATAEGGRRLVTRAAAAGLLLTVFQNRRWDGDFLTLRRLLGEGRLGAVHRYESRFERWRPVPKPGWRQEPEPGAAGGVLYDLGSHLIDQARVLFGRVTAVYAELDRRVPGSEVDDDAFVALTHESGVRSHLWMSSAAARPGPRLRVLGSRAAYTKHGLDVQEAALRAGLRPAAPDWGSEPAASWGELGAGEAVEVVPTASGDYPAFYRGLVRSLRDGAPPPVDARDAVAVVHLIEAARRSAAEGTTVAGEP